MSANDDYKVKPITFSEHTVKRRQWLSSLWNPDEIVYGAIGPKLTNEFSTDTKHDYNSHFAKTLAVDKYRKGFDEAVRILSCELPNLQQPSDFEELYDWLYTRLNNKLSKDNDPNGIGLLALYDICIAIGCNLYPKVLPQKFVYVHGNLVKSAEVLIGRIKDCNKVEIGAFSSILPHYSALEIEDILCLYGSRIIAEGCFKKDWLKKIP